VRYTGSPRATVVLERWDEEAPSFWRIASKAASAAALTGTAADSG